MSLSRIRTALGAVNSAISQSLLNFLIGTQYIAIYYLLVKSTDI
nr:MAG TPA: hypothetical protein [Caudoviricetes sp.]